MKIYALAFLLLETTAAFVPLTPSKPSLALHSAVPKVNVAGVPASAQVAKSEQDTEYGEAPQQQGMFPLDLPLERIEGGNTVRTWVMPSDCERVQMLFKTMGRPLRAKVEMWQGPQRTTHLMDIDNMNGLETPFRALLKFKKGPQVLRITTKGSEYPLFAGIQPIPADRNKSVNDASETVWNMSTPQIIQGGPIDLDGTTKGGAIRVFPVPANVESVQVLFWSKAVGSKSAKAIIEVLQGPNNKKQAYNLSCSGSSQPYHAVFETPGGGCSILIRNKNFLEFPFEAVVVPYTYKVED